jgi:hypothetical protein
MMELGELESLLAKSWCRESSSDPDGWSEENPAWGQCAVTAAIVDDYLGGEIVWAKAALPDGGKVSHYFNLIAGQEYDLTRKQFPDGTVVPPGIPKTNGFNSTREYVLSYEATLKRYELLKEKIENLL